MPIYEYHCQGCNKDHEIIQKVSDAPLAICPDCGGKLEKKLSLGGFQLKGGGWYKDGYSSSGSSGSSQKGTSAPKTEVSPAPVEKPKSTKE